MSKRLRAILVVVLAAFAAVAALGWDAASAMPGASAPASIACADDDDDAHDVPYDVALAAPDADDDDGDGDGDANADPSAPSHAASTTPLIAYGASVSALFSNRAGIRAARGHAPSTERPPRA